MCFHPKSLKNQVGNMSYLKDFQKNINNNDYPRFLKLWEEYCYSEQPDQEEFKQILLEAKESELCKPLGRHVSRALKLWNKLPPSPIKDEIIKLIYDIQNINSDDLAETALLFLQEKYPNDPNFENKIRLIGLKTQDDFQGAISHFELLSHLEKGNFVFHKAGWGTGEIIDVSALREEISLEFEYVIGVKHLSFFNAMKTLLPLLNDHFLSRRFGNPDQLEQEAKSNPLSILRLLLRDLGPKSAAEIKDELMDLVIPAEEWSRWWQLTRSKVKKDTKIEAPKSINQKFRLLKEEISHEESLYKSLDAKPSINQTIQIIHSFFKDFPQTLKNPDFQTTLKEKLNALLTFAEVSETQKIQIFFLQEDITGERNFEPLIEKIENFTEFINEVHILSLKKRILIEIRKLKKNWAEIFFSLLFPLNQNILRDYILSEVLQANLENQLAKKIEELLQHPLIYPYAFVWYFSKIRDQETKLPFSDIEGEKRFFEAFLILLDHLGQKEQFRELAKKMTALVTGNKFKMIRRFMENATIEEVKEYILLASKCRSLTPHDIKIITSYAEVVYPSLRHSKKKEEIVQNFVWTTEEGYKKIQERIKHLATVETIANAKEIEEARAHGDLRENAEYKAALEKRNQIQNELQLLSEQFNQARIINKNDINIEKVGIGCMVTCENEKQEKMTFIILGPWDANPEKHILSFQSQLAQVMSGLTIGEKFRFHGEDFTIKRIQNFFE